jgi:hypothetical protein
MELRRQQPVVCRTSLWTKGRTPRLKHPRAVEAVEVHMWKSNDSLVYDLCSMHGHVKAKKLVGNMFLL